MPAGPTLLDAQDVHVSFGGTRALAGASVTVRAGTVHGIAGANGSGKSTLLNVISRIVRPQSGRIQYLNRDLLKLPGHQVALHGIGRAFQTPVLFHRLSVVDNVLVGLQPQLKGSAMKDLIRWPAYSRSMKTGRVRAMELLDSFGVPREMWSASVDKLNLGQQRRVELVRVLACEPRLLLLDEPAVGLAASELGELRDLLLRVRHDDMAIVLVEHNVSWLRSVAEIITVMDQGVVLAEGDESVFEDRRVQVAYLGTSSDAVDGEDVSESAFEDSF
jgi:ABC-type branched-subunit amino acid transport system ATPase component